MPIKAVQENGAVREKVVEIFFVGHFFLPEHRIVPTSAHDPPLSRMCVGVVFQSPADLCKIFGVVQMDSVRGKIDPSKKWLWLSTKPGSTSWPAASITFVVRSTKFSDGGIVADSDNFIRADGQRLCPRLLGVEGINTAVKHHHVRSILYFSGALRCEGARPRRKKRKELEPRSECGAQSSTVSSP